MEGYKQMFNDQLVTVWSAPNYCYRCGPRFPLAQIVIFTCAIRIGCLFTRQWKVSSYAEGVAAVNDSLDLDLSADYNSKDIQIKTLNLALQNV